MLTNDLGEFRVYGLEPGVFYVGVATLNTVAGMERPGAMIYAPGVASLSYAQQVTVGLSQTVSGISIVARSMKTARIAGMALDANQQPIIGPVQLRPRDVEVGFGAVLQSVPVGPDGRFVFTDVAPGNYTIGAVHRVSAAGVLVGALAAVAVDGSDLTDVRLIPIATVTASGRVIAPSGAPRSLASTRIMFDPVDASLTNLFTEGALIGTDLTFSTHAFAMRMKVNVPQLPQGWMLKVVRQGGIDVTDSGVDLALGGDVRDIEVEITDRLTEVTGVVRGANGDLADDYTVIIFAKDPTRRTGNPRILRECTARPEPFVLHPGLAAGDYLAAALDVRRRQSR